MFCACSQAHSRVPWRPASCRLIESGLPARRVVALIAQDGSVVTELRGLSAWLATHSARARHELIEGDPIGVGLYGDIRGFQVKTSTGC